MSTMRQGGSQFLTGRQAENVLDAVSYLNAAHGLVLDTHFVIAHEVNGPRDHEDASRSMWQLFHRMGKWFHRRGGAAFWVYAHELSPRYGLHTHVLAHVGERWNEFQGWLPRAVAHLWPTPLPVGMLCVRHRRQAELRHQIALQWRWVRYILKGIPPTLSVVGLDNRLIKPLHQVIRVRAAPAGVVRCRKRAGVSPNIGRRARERADYLSPFGAGRDDALFDGQEFVAHADSLAHARANKLAQQLRCTLADL